MSKQLEFISGPVTSVNSKKTGIKVQGCEDWLNVSQYHPAPVIPSQKNAGRTTMYKHTWTLSRRRALSTAGAAAAGAAAFMRLPAIASAQGLRPTDPIYPFDEYEAIVNREVTIRQVYEWPNLSNPIIFGNVSNGLNGFQFAYGLAPQQIQVVVQAYSSANLAMYDDSAWSTYQLGEVFNIKDPASGELATRNQWYSSKNPVASPPPTDRSNAYYSDTSIEGLQRRGVLFLVCHQTIRAHAGQVASSAQNTDGKSADQILADLQDHLIPDGLLVPAAVGELVRLQDKAYRLIVNT